MKYKLLLLCLLWMAAANNVMGERLAFGEAQTDNSAKGLVYASEAEMNIEDITGWTNRHYLWDFDVDDENDGAPPDGTVYWIYAKPKAGYKFKEWRLVHFNYNEFFSSSAKQKVVFDSKDDEPFLAVFSKIGDPHLEGVPADFSVYVDGTKVARDDSGNYTIAEGEDVRIEWSDDAVYGFDQGMDPDEDEKFIEFTMPEDDLVLPLTSVEFPEGITEIKSYAFYNCKELTYVTLPSTLKSIGASAFEGCRLSTISIPTNVTAIGDCAFRIINLTDVYYAGALNQWTQVSKGEGAFGSPTYHYQHVITFNANGGSLDAPITMVTVDGNLPSLPTPTRDDWEFKGWFTKATGGSQVTTETDFFEDCEIYAQWYQGSRYTLSLPNVIIGPNVEFTRMLVDVTELLFGTDANGRTPTGLRVVLNGGTLVNQADNSKTIPFMLTTSESSKNASNNKSLDFNASEYQGFYIYIPEDNWNVPLGTYTGTITYKVRWRYEDSPIWSDDIETGTIPVKVTIKQAYMISTSTSPAEGGIVSGGGTYDEGTEVTMTATPNEGYKFVNWTIDGVEAGSEPSYQLVADGDHTVVANFERVYTVSVSASPAEGGTVTGGGTYEKFSYASLTATPTEGYRFVNWTFNGLNGGSELTLPLIVDEDYTIVANFERVYSLTGKNVLFYPEDGYDHITEAAEGEQVTVSFNPECPPAGKYFGGAYSSNDVTPTSIGEYDAMFTMPAKAVNVDVVMNERQDLTVDLTANDPVDISFEVFTQLHRLEDNFHNDPNADKAYLDLNADGTDDLELDLVVNINGIEKVSIKKLAGGYASDWRFNFILTKEEFGFPYNGIIFDFGVRTPGDINSDGKVNIADVVELVNAMKLKPSARFNLLNADVNNDNNINNDDIAAIVNMIIN